MDEVEQDNSDFKRGSSWATVWQSLFFSLDIIVLAVSLILNLLLLRAMARNTNKETSIVYQWIVFIFFTSLVDDALIIEYFMTIHGHQVHTTTVCRLTTFVTIGNRILQALAVIALLYYSWLMIEFKMSRSVENKIRKWVPLAIVSLIVVEVIIALPPALNVTSSRHAQFCLYLDNSITTLRQTGWLFHVLFPYYIPLVLSVFPVIKILLKLRQQDGVSDRDRGQYQIVLAIGCGYFFFHLLYYLLWLGREVESLVLDRSGFRRLLGLHVWYITRPMFALISLGWHITTPLAPFVFDTDLAEDFPGPYVNKRRGLGGDGGGAFDQSRTESIVLEERGQVGPNEDDSDGRTGDQQEVKVTRTDQWTEIHNPLPNPVSTVDDEMEYHQIPL